MERIKISTAEMLRILKRKSGMGRIEWRNFCRRYYPKNRNVSTILAVLSDNGYEVTAAQLKAALENELKKDP